MSLSFLGHEPESVSVRLNSKVVGGAKSEPLSSSATRNPISRLIVSIMDGLSIRSGEGGKNTASAADAVDGRRRRVMTVGYYFFVAADDVPADCWSLLPAPHTSPSSSSSILFIHSRAVTFGLLFAAESISPSTYLNVSHDCRAEAAGPKRCPFLPIIRLQQQHQRRKIQFSQVASHLSEPFCLSARLPVRVCARLPVCPAAEPSGPRFMSCDRVS